MATMSNRSALLAGTSCIAVVAALAIGACGGADANVPQDDGGTSTGTGGSSSGAGGSSSGTGGSAGTNGGTGGGATQCTAGMVTFHLSAADGNNTDYCVGAGCSVEWMTVRSAAGQAINLASGCTTTCEKCQPVACTNLCIAPQRMKADGETTTWDGTYFQASKCNATTTCSQMQCAAPGQYIATMCAALSPPDSGLAGFCGITGQQPTCVAVPFDYPSTTVVEGVIGATK